MKRGFTLVEILGVLILLAVVSMITYPIVDKSIKENKEQLYRTQIKEFEAKAEDWAYQNSDLLPTNENASITVTLIELKKAGLIPLDVRNPITNELFPNDLKITITYNNNNYSFVVDENSGSDINNEVNENSPILILNGNSLEYVEINSEYEEKGAIAKDKLGNLLEDITIMYKENNTEVSTVETNNFKTYTVVYTISSEVNGEMYSSSVIRTVIVRDTTAPILTVSEKVELLPEQLPYFNLLEGVSASDNSNETIQIQTSGFDRLPTDKIIKYTACDSSNNCTEKRRIVKIKSNTSDEIYVDNSGANRPELLNNMLPIRYNGSNWLIAQQTEKWYDYDKKEWANAVVFKNSVIKDISDNHNDITITNKYTNQGGMAYFDGVDDYLDLGHKNYDFGTNASMVLRFKMHSINETINNHLFGNWESAGLGFYTTSKGQLMFDIYNENVSNYVYAHGPTIKLEQWYTVVATYDGTTIKFYINGELYTSVVTNGEIKPSVVQFLLGANPGGNDKTSEFTNVTVANAMVYDRTLSETEITNNFSNEITSYDKTDLLFGYDYFGSTSDYYKAKYLNKENIIVDENDIALWYVWIPRYKYTIWNGNNGSSNPQEIKIEFETGINSTGTVKCVDSINNSNVSEICTDKIKGNVINGISTYTHPAFTFGNQELTGFWVGKFEVSGTTDKITIKPNVTSLRNQTVSSFFNSIKTIQTNYNIVNGDSHMMKNMEWGAVTYLSHSKYGTCTSGVCNEVGINNNSSFITGCGAEAGSASNTVCNIYNSTEGIKASTTRNIYGVYDMSGNSWEYVMGNEVDSTGVFYPRNSGFSSVPNSKYYDKYTYNISNSTHSRGKLGDATKETLSIYGDNYGGWYKDISNFAYSSSSWLLRGGLGQYGNTTGIFGIGTNHGQIHETYSSRAVIIPN